MMTLLTSLLWNLYLTSKRVYRAIKPLLVALLILFSITYFIYWKYIKEPEVEYYPDITMARRMEEAKLREMLLTDRGSGCAMPDLDPFAPEVTQFKKPVAEIKCQGMDWVECNLTECRVKPEILRKKQNVRCGYKDIMFVDDYSTYQAASKRLIGDKVYKLKASDHVKVSCTGSDVSDIGFLQERWYGYKAGFRPVDRQPPTSPSALNVMMIIIESMSRNGFIRQLPKSYKVLEEELGAVILKSYNIVGDGTISALMPLLTGHTILEVPDWRKSLNNTAKVDIEPFIFHLLKKEGYITAYFEDRPHIGTFQYNCNGFKEPPTDHYLRPFFVSATKNGVKWWMGLRQRYCMGDTPEHVMMLNLTSQFFKLKGKKFGVTFNVALSHDDMNMISAADEDLVSFLRQFRDDGLMEDTLLLVMSDHGPRFAAIRNTRQGSLEERLPMASILLPRQLQQRLPRALTNLRANSDVLSTPFDVHATILHALGLGVRKEDDRGLSLLEPVSPRRSCAEAGVTLHWCACAAWRSLTPEDPMFERTATILAEYINKLTNHRRSQCAIRNLVHIELVRRKTALNIASASNKTASLTTKTVAPSIEYYQAKIVMDPAKAIYEGTLMYNATSDSFDISVSDISRVNAYDTEPSCISATEPKLNRFCYCK